MRALFNQQGAKGAGGKSDTMFRSSSNAGSAMFGRNAGAFAPVFNKAPATEDNQKKMLDLTKESNKYQEKTLGLFEQVVADEWRFN